MKMKEKARFVNVVKNNWCQAAQFVLQPGGQGDQESLTSSEFERFLAERAAAAEALPTLSTAAVTATSNSSTTSNQNIQRQINKDQDKSLFAL